MALVPNLGDINRFAAVYNRIKNKSKMDLLLLGGSITAGGYFMEFLRFLKEKENIEVEYHNHGHGATEIKCKFSAIMT
jgi:hypothetical protein